MSDADIVGRLLAIETIAITSLALYLANSRNDPDYSKAQALLAYIQETIQSEGQARGLSPAAQQAARKHGTKLLEQVSQNLRVLRGEGGQPH